jgi:hypothetical protein
MPQLNNFRWTQVCLAGAVLLGGAAWAEPQVANSAQTSILELGKELQVGDVVFIRIPKAPFTKVADTTSSWTNHVGIVSDVSGKEPVISESRVPVSGETSWSKFVQRSDKGRVAVTRLPTPLDAQQQHKLRDAVAARRGIMYDTGFDLHSKRQFCSRYVREALNDAVGVQLGEVEDFSTLLKRNPQADQEFWKVWYFGNIPWQRETVTPASLLKDGRMRIVFDGNAVMSNQQKAIKGEFAK